MKNLKLPISILLCLSLNFTYGFNKIEHITKINNATIFTQGAQISRTKKIELLKGENIIIFKGLEKDINPNSIQFYGINGSNNFTAVSTQFRLKETTSTKLKKSIEIVNDSIADIDLQINRISNKLKNLSKEKEIIQKHSKINERIETSYVLQIKELITYYRKITNEIDQLIYDLEKRRKDLYLIKSGLNIKLNEYTRTQYTGIIEAKVYANNAMSQTIKLSYMVTNAGWTPFYEIKSQGINHPLKVICKATINQNTGINWKNIKLTLSTRKPEILHAVPKVHPWALHFQTKMKTYTQQNQIINNQSVSNTMIPLSNTLPTVTPSTNTPYGPDPTQYLSRFKHATHKMINKEYHNELNYNIQGNNGMAVVELDKFEMETEYIYYSVPKYDQNVYLVAEIKQWEKYDLIPAFANIFLEGTYIGKLFIDPTNISDKLNLMLGRDQDILIERRKINHTGDKERKISGGLEITELGIEIVIKNNKSKPVKVVIKDQVPISANTEIEVNIKDISKAKIDDKTGTLTWTYELDSKKTKKHTISYEVKRPKNKKIANF